MLIDADVDCPDDYIILSAKREKAKDIFVPIPELDLLTGELSPGFEEASPVVSALRKYSEKIENKYGFVLIDTAAGAHCNVIAAVLGVDFALAVTEPTPLGEHDLKLILKLLKILLKKQRMSLTRTFILFLAASTSLTLRK